MFILDQATDLMTREPNLVLVAGPVTGASVNRSPRAQACPDCPLAGVRGQFAGIFTANMCEHSVSLVSPLV